MVSTSWHHRLPAVLCVGALLVLCACDKGPEQLAQAEAQYTDLVQRGVPPRDPAWDSVIAAFEAIPKDSKARPQAEQRLATLKALRGNLPPRPLATPGVTGPGADAVEAQRAECEKLAKALGLATEDTREQAQQALQACRERLVRLEATTHPPGEEGGEPETDGGR